MNYILPSSRAPFRHRGWGIIALFMFANALFAANPSLTLQVSSETAPAGGFVQFKVYASAPALISSGAVSMHLDASIFGGITGSTAFSATGDQLGAGGYIRSQSGGLGQLPGLPIMVVNAPVLAGVRPGTTSTVTVDPTLEKWLDPAGDVYNVAVIPGTFTVGGTLSVQAVTPGSGLYPAGTVLQITGTGFDANTAVSIDGVSLASTRFVSAQEIDLTLAGATEIAGKRVHVVGTGGAAVDFFPVAGETAVTNDAPGLIILPFMPLTSSPMVAWDFLLNHSNPRIESCVQNPSPSPVTLTYYFVGVSPVLTKTIVVPPFGMIVADTETLTESPGSQFYMSASSPVRVGEVVLNSTPVSVSFSFSVPTPITKLPPGLGIGTPGPVTFDWQVGSPAPQPPARSVSIVSAFPYSISLSNGAESWLSVAQSSNGQSLTITPSVSGLGPGSITATVTLTAQMPPDLAAFGPVSQSFTVTLNAIAQPMLVGGVPQTVYSAVGLPAPAPIAIPIQGIGSAPFTTEVSTTSGAGWLSVLPPSGTAPTSLMLSVDPAGLVAGSYSGDVKIQGPANSVDYPVTLVLAPAGVLVVDQPSITLTATQGGSAPGFVSIHAQAPSTTLSVLLSVQSCASWISTRVFGLTVQVFTAVLGLDPGTCNATLTITSNLNLVATIPVTLTVTPPVVTPPVPPAQLTIAAPNLTLGAPAGTAATASLSIGSASGPTAFNITPGDGGPFFKFTGTLVAPTTIQVSASAAIPGTYQTSLTVSWSGGSATIPVTFYAGPSAASPPQIAEVLASGSMTPGPIAPGELVTILGMGLANSPSFLQLDSSGKVVTSLGGSRVLINGVAAPLIYAGTGQLNAIVPFEAAASGVTSVQVAVNNLTSGIWEPPAAPAAPSVFTLTESGIGPGAILNVDSTVNSPSNPAARGSIVQIFATGGGQTNPSSATGALAPGKANLALNTTVSIGGVDAPVIYAGAAPGEVNGLVQINATVPQSVAQGPAVPIVVKVGAAPSQTGVTVAIQ